MIDLFVSETAVYTPGAGLGATKAKDIGKYTEGFTSYVAMAQDSVCIIVLLSTCTTYLIPLSRHANVTTVESVLFVHISTQLPQRFFTSLVLVIYTVSYTQDYKENNLHTVGIAMHELQTYFECLQVPTG